MLNKKIVFFDGDGTLWYPKTTKWQEKPYLVYGNANYLEQLMLTPTTYETLIKLKKRGVILIVLSTHPNSLKTAQDVILEKVAYLGLRDLFSDVYATLDDPSQKGKQIVTILKKLGIPKSQALMVGDSYRYDYNSAQQQGIDAVLIKTTYGGSRANRIRRTINCLEEVLDYI